MSFYSGKFYLVVYHKIESRYSFSQKLLLKVKANGLMGRKLVTKNMAFSPFFLVLYVNVENEVKALNILMREKRLFVSINMQKSPMLVVYNSRLTKLV